MNERKAEEKYLSKEAPYIHRDRGRLLTAWLVIFLLATGFFLYGNITLGQWLNAAWAVVGILSAIGVWNFYKLGFYGMLIFYGYSIATSLDRQSVDGLFYNVLFMGLTYILVREKLESFR